MVVSLLQAPTGAWWSSNGFWIFIALFVIGIVLLLPWTWYSTRRRR